MLAVLTGGVVALSQRAGAQDLPDLHILDKKSKDARGRFQSLVGKSKATDPRIDAILKEISRSQLEESVGQLQDLETRWTGSDEKSAKAVEWLDARLSGFGYPSDHIRLQSFSMPNGSIRQNVLCSPPTLQAGTIIVCAHYNSISEAAASSAPGADDNASGIAAMLEAARVLRTTALGGSVMYAAFGGEEQGLWGSRAAADAAAAEGWPIGLVINLDMVGYVNPAKADTIIVEFDQGNAKPGNDLPAQAFAFQMAQVVSDYTGLAVEHTDIWNSDYMPFEAKGFPCIGLYDEGADAAFYHRTTDTNCQCEHGPA